ncbi:MAG: LysR family transcriptional regulator [Gammaproteobacteria bacterium]|nr:LysR family transcriptional regulator [Gammaproteobacteria bacterium]
MDINALQAFTQVADEGSFSRAAEALFLTQPAVSKRVGGLENELHARLFDRIGRRVQLTEAGRALLPHARRILREVKESRQSVAALGGRIGGRLTVGTSHHIGLHRLPAVLGKFTAGYPEVELDLHFMDSEQACLAVEQGNLELGIVTLPNQPNNALLTTVVWPDPLDIVARHDAPLAQLRQPTLADLIAYPAVLPGAGTFTRRVLEAALRPQQPRLSVALETNYLEIIKMLVSVGLGWSALPRTMIDGPLCSVPIPALALHRDLGIVRHSQHTLTSAARALVDLLNQTTSTTA